MQSNLLTYIKDPKNPTYNFNLGLEYERLGHTASAAGYYVRTAEFSENKVLAYEALLRLALCFSKQGSRVFTVKGVLLRAIALMPTRPEAYFLLARAYEHNKDWQECYTWACLGEEKFNYKNGCSGSPGLDFVIPDEWKTLLTDVEYPGYEGFPFEKAVAGWWIGLYDESLHIFRLLKKNNNLPINYKNSIVDNLNRLQDKWDDPLKYDNTLFERLKCKFPGSEHIKENYSQCYQDMFVLTMLNGKKNGYYLEIGCGDPFYGNNTALLEKQFNWTGISIDKEIVWKSRKTTPLCFDATKLDYDKLLHYNYDYLQIDCDEASLDVLFKIPFWNRKFSVITFEHDDYRDETNSIKNRSREYLKRLS